MIRSTLIGITFTLVAVFANATLAQNDNEVRYLQDRWAEINYQLEGKTRITAFEELIARAEQDTAAYPDSADLWIWSGIIKSTYAGAKGGLSALKYAKASKTDLEKAMELDSTALHGSAYTSLGTLYFNVPGWPIGFGDDKKAEALLQKALALNPQGIDPNYFYGDFLWREKRYNEARTYLLKARQAAPRPGRLVADRGRQKEIDQLLAEVEQKLNH